MKRYQVIIMRGLPGAGKSTFVKNNFPNAVVCSADDYHIIDGEYKFDVKNLAKAHEYCRIAFVTALDNGVKTVVVDNTNIRLNEFDPYIQVALRSGYDVEVYRLDNTIEKSNEYNTHKVPLDTIKRMDDKFEPFDGERFVEAWWKGVNYEK